MALKISYTASLELLVLDVLLPVYEKYQVSIGNTEPLKGINNEILAQMKSKKPLAALLKPTLK